MCLFKSIRFGEATNDAIVTDLKGPPPLFLEIFGFRISHDVLDVGCGRTVCPESARRSMNQKKPDFSTMAATLIHGDSEVPAEAKWKCQTECSRRQGYVVAADDANTLHLFRIEDSVSCEANRYGGCFAKTGGWENAGKLRNICEIVKCYFCKRLREHRS